MIETQEAMPMHQVLAEKMATPADRVRAARELRHLAEAVEGAAQEFMTATADAVCRRDGETPANRLAAKVAKRLHRRTRTGTLAAADMMIVASSITKGELPDEPFPDRLDELEAMLDRAIASRPR